MSSLGSHHPDHTGQEGWAGWCAAHGLQNGVWARTRSCCTPQLRDATCLLYNLDLETRERPEHTPEVQGTSCFCSASHQPSSGRPARCCARGVSCFHPCVSDSCREWRPASGTRSRAGCWHRAAFPPAATSCCGDNSDRGVIKQEPFNTGSVNQLSLRNSPLQVSRKDHFLMLLKGEPNEALCIRGQDLIRVYTESCYEV